MGATNSPLPIFRADRFDFGSQAEAMERLVPRHHNRPPKDDDRDHHRWGIEGWLAPDHPTKVLLAVNLGDVKDESGGTIIEGQELAVMFATARFRRLTREFPSLIQLDGDEAGILIPRASFQPLYEEGMRVAAETVFPPAAEPAGRVATGGASIGINPVPMPMPAAA